MRIAKIFAAVGLLVVVGAGLSRISFDIDIFRLLPASIRQAEALSIFLRHFARPSELVVTLEASDAEAAHDAALSLARMLREHPTLVARAVARAPWEDAPAEISEFAAYLLANAPPDRVRAALDRMSPERAADTLRETYERIEDSVSPEEMLRWSNDPFRLTEALPEMGDATARLPGEFSSPDGAFRVVYVEAATPLGNYRASIRWVAEIRRLIDQWQVGRDVTVGITGEPAFVAEISGGMEADMQASAVVTMVVIAAIFWLTYRRLRPLGLLLVMLAGIFVLTLATAGFFLRDLTVIGVGFASIMIGLSVDYGYLIYQQWIEHGGDAAAVRRRCRLNILYAAATTAAAFFLLNASSLPGLSQLGNLVGIGILIGAIVMYYAFAALLVKFPWRPRPAETATSLFWRPPFVRACAWGVGALVLACVAGLPLAGGVQMDDTAKALRPRHSPAGETLDRLSARIAGDSDPFCVLVVGADEADVLARLREAERLIREIGGAETSWLSPAPVWPRTVRQRENLPLLASLDGQQSRLKAALAEAGFADEAFAGTDLAISHWAKWGRAHPPVWPENPSSEWILRRIASHRGGEYAALGIVHPAPGRADALAMARADGIYFTSWQQLGAEMKRVIPGEFRWLVFALVLAVGVLLLLAYRSVLDAALILGTMAVVFAALAGAMAWLGMQWNFFNMAAVLLLMGTGVDYSIHMILALRGRSGEVAQARRTIGKVIFLCAASAAVGFGSISWASNFGLASLGRTCALGLVLDALISVYLLPPVWEFCRRFAGGKSLRQQAS